MRDRTARARAWLAVDALPWLAVDARRVLVASVVMIAAVFPVVRLANAWFADTLVPIVFSIFALWSLYGVLWIALTLWTFHGLSGAAFRERLDDSTPRGRAGRISHVLSGGNGGAWAAQLALVSTVAVLLLSRVPELGGEPALLGAAVAVVTVSWLLIVCSYAVRYAREQGLEPGLEFPGAAPLAFSDYFYLATQLSTTFASSDVQVVSGRMRRLVTGHSIIAFAFNTVVIALFVSLLVGAPG